MAKPCEPPAGIARLSGMLGSLGIEHALLDANIEGFLHLLSMPVSGEKERDVWTGRAIRNRERNLSLMRTPGLYRNIARYRRAVSDIGRALTAVTPPGIRVGLANYAHHNLSPLRSADLLTAAENPELSPFHAWFRARLEALFSRRKPAHVGISLNYLSQALCAFSFIGVLRSRFPDVKIILGGGLVTSWVRNPAWKDPFQGMVDHYVSGPGERGLLSILGMHAPRKRAWRPEYRSLQPGRYLAPGGVLPYSASSGCYWHRCTFCPEQAEGALYQPVPVKQVIEELQGIAGETNPRLVHFLDNAISPVLLGALASGTRVFPWYGFARVSPELADPDFCMALKRSGCVMLKLGIESGDQGVLDRLQKGINVGTAGDCLRNLKHAGIATYVYLIFGTPPETEAGARKTLAFAVKHHTCIDFLNLAIFNMPRCGEPVNGVETMKFSEGDLSLYTDFVHPNGWDRRRVRLFLEHEFRKHPAVAGILKHDPPVFTSNHAPFFAMEKNRNEAVSGTRRHAAAR